MDSLTASAAGATGVAPCDAALGKSVPLETRTAHVPYRIRVATAEDLPQVFALRYDIFFGELGATGNANDAALDRGLDVDDHDALCDHLVICQGPRIVGTYRLLPLERLAAPGQLGAPSTPYSQSEFDVTQLRTTFGDARILELGRSCIHPDHRNGQAARLLWAGLASYMTERGFQALMGCVSVHGISALQAHRMSEMFKSRGIWDPRFELEVQPDYREDFDGHDPLYRDLGHLPEDVAQLMPPLMKGYINLGARVCGGPAYDASFGCHDFLMLLETSALPQRQLQALLALSRR